LLSNYQFQTSEEAHKAERCRAVAQKKKSSGDLKQEKIWSFWLQVRKPCQGAFGSSSAEKVCEKLNFSFFVITN
jgi:hypothetical protein